MLFNKISVLVILVAAFVGYEYYQVEVPSFVDYLEWDPVRFKFNEIGKKYFFKIVQQLFKYLLGKLHSSDFFLNRLI